MSNLKGLFYKKYQNEYFLALLCSKKSKNELDLEKIDNLLDNEINWDRLLSFARNNRIFPLVATFLISQSGLNITRELRDRLKKDLYIICRQNMSMTLALRTCLHALQAENVSAMTLKGPAFNLGVLNGIGLRTFSDLDIIVRRENVWKSLNILEKLGFVPLCRLKKEQVEKLVITENEMPCVDKNNNICVDLQWGLGGLFLKKQLEYDFLHQDCEKIQIAGESFDTLGGVSAIVFYCIHGAEHGWRTFDHVSCFYEYIFSRKQIDWNTVIYFANNLGVIRLLRVGVYLVRRFYGIELPKQINSEIDDSNCVRISDNLIKSLCGTSIGKIEEKERRRTEMLHFELFQGINEKANYVGKLLFSPTRYDWQLYPVPANLSFGLRFLRPLRLLTECIVNLPKNLLKLKS